MTARTASRHSVRVLRSTTEPGECRGVCACGWSIAGDLEYVRGEAARHEARRGESTRLGPPLHHAGFVSGLPGPVRRR